MPLLLITTDPQLQAAVESRVHSAGLAVHVQSTAADASAAMRAALPDALLVDLPHRSRERLRLLDEARRTYPAANIPIVLLKPPHAAGEPDPAELHLNRVALPVDLHTRLQAFIDAQHARSPGQAHPYTLDTLARIWRQGLSGILHLPHQIIPLCSGGVIDPDHLSHLEAALPSAGVRFEEDSIQGLGDWLSVGTLLWQAASRRTRPGFLQAHHHLLLKPRPNAERAELLPLPEAIRPLLASRRPLPLARQLTTLELAPATIEGPLEALILLGLYRLQEPPRTPQRSRSALQNLPPPSSPPPRERGSPAASIDPDTQARLERRRLQREAEVLAAADEWTVLGLQPTTSPAELAEAGERQQTRYARLARSHADPEVRQSAQRVLTRIEEALACLQALQAIYAAYDEPEDLSTREEIAFREGFVALLRRDLPRAQRCFAAAYDAQMQSARNLAYLGWTRYQLDHATLSTAREMVQLSDSLKPHVPQTQLFLATLEAESGELEQAEQRLSTLIRRGSAPEDAHSLFRRVRQQLAANSRGR